MVDTTDIGDNQRLYQNLEDTIKWMDGGYTKGSTIFNMSYCEAEAECEMIKQFIEGRMEPFAEGGAAAPNAHVPKKENKGKKGKWDARMMREVKVHPGP